MALVIDLTDDSANLPRRGPRTPCKRSVAGDDDDDVVIVSEERSAKKPKKEAAQGDKLDTPASEALGADDDLLVVSEAGHVATRDFPHERSSCYQHKFSKVTCVGNAQYCSKCFCFVCDVEAFKCSMWGTGASTSDHCHAHNNDHWARLRRLVRTNRKAEVEAAHASGSPMCPPPPPPLAASPTRARHGRGWDAVAPDVRGPSPVAAAAAFAQLAALLGGPQGLGPSVAAAPAAPTPGFLDFEQFCAILGRQGDGRASPARAHYPPIPAAEAPRLQPAGPGLRTNPTWAVTTAMTNEGLAVQVQILACKPLYNSLLPLLGAGPVNDAERMALAGRIGLLLAAARGELPLPLPLAATALLYEGGMPPETAALYALARLLLHATRAPSIHQVQRLIATGTLSTEAASWAMEIVVVKQLCERPAEPSAQAGADMWLPGVAGMSNAAWSDELLDLCLEMYKLLYDAGGVLHPGAKQDLVRATAAWQGAVAHATLQLNTADIDMAVKVMDTLRAIQHYPVPAPPRPAAATEAEGAKACLDCEEPIPASAPRWKVRCLDCWRAWKSGQPSRGRRSGRRTW